MLPDDRAGRRIGPYRIVRQLAEGGMGVVYEAVHEKIRRRVAIKVLNRQHAASAEVRARLFNEAIAVNVVDHPGIVQISDYDELPDGTAFLVMEFLRGETLLARIERLTAEGARLSIETTICLGWQIADALAAAHAKHIVHRDLKPDNVMLIPCPTAYGGERTKLLDFGIAKLRATESGVKTRTRMLMGTPAYMSPEQCRGAGRVDEKSDCYSFGVVLYLMLAGRLPFISEGPYELIAMHLRDPPPPLTLFNPDLPRELGELVMALLKKAPDARPTMSATAELLARLGRFLLHGPASSPLTIQSAAQAPLPRVGADTPTQLESPGPTSEDGVALPILEAVSSTGAAESFPAPTRVTEVLGLQEPESEAAVLAASRAQQDASAAGISRRPALRWILAGIAVAIGSTGLLYMTQRNPVARPDGGVRDLGTKGTAPGQAGSAGLSGTLADSSAADLAATEIRWNGPEPSVPSAPHTNVTMADLASGEKTINARLDTDAGADASAGDTHNGSHAGQPVASRVNPSPSVPAPAPGLQSGKLVTSPVSRLPTSGSAHEGTDTPRELVARLLALKPTVPAVAQSSPPARPASPPAPAPAARPPAPAPGGPRLPNSMEELLYADQQVTAARAALAEGQCQRAIELARPVAEIKPSTVWLLIGEASCCLRDLQMARTARKNLYGYPIAQRELMTRCPALKVGGVE